MNERELINKIESLKSIKPKEDWVLSTRNNLFEEKETPILFFFGKRQVLVGSMLLLMIGIFTTVAGGSFSRIAEKGRSYFVSDSESDIILLSEREKQEEIERLSLVLSELKDARTEIQREFASSIETKTEEEIVKIAKDFAPSILEIGEKEDMITGTLGVKISDEERSANQEIAKLIIQDLERRSLPEGEKALLKEARTKYDNGEFLPSLRIALEIGQGNITIAEEEKSVGIMEASEVREDN